MSTFLYVKLDVNYLDDPKVMLVSTDAELLYVRALCYSKRLLSDGFIATRQLFRIASDLGTESGSDSLAKELVGAGLWDEVESGWQIVAWAKHNDLAQEVEAKREAKRDGGLLGNHKRWHTGRSGSPSDDCRYCESEGLVATRSVDRLASESTEEETETEEETTTAADKPPRKPRKPDHIFDALVEVCGLDTSDLTKSARGRINKAAKELRDIGASAEGIKARAAVHRQRWPDAELTPTSLSTNYAQLGTSKAAGPDLDERDPTTGMLRAVL